VTNVIPLPDPPIRWDGPNEFLAKPAIVEQTMETARAILQVKCDENAVWVACLCSALYEAIYESSDPPRCFDWCMENFNKVRRGEL
jgi:hypothetical protein